jgi:hypothetical protein
MGDAGVADGGAPEDAVFPIVDMTHGQALAYLRFTARKCLVDFLLEQFGGDLSGPAGYACCYLVDAVTADSQLLSWFPCMFLYFPSSHAIHVPPFGPVNPRLQIQATNSILPPGDTEPDGQFVHVPTPVAPTAVE